jgi:hypothetical protein
MVGEGYIELYCPECEAFETDELDLRLSELGELEPEEFKTDEEFKVYQEWLERKDE